MPEVRIFVTDQELEIARRIGKLWISGPIDADKVVGVAAANGLEEMQRRYRVESCLSPDATAPAVASQRCRAGRCTELGPCRAAPLSSTY